MTERREEMTWLGGDASAVRPAARDPEVVAKPRCCRFTAEYRLRVLEETDRYSKPGEIGRFLRREGLYSSHLAVWRKARHDGTILGPTPRKRGRKPARRNPLEQCVHQLEAEAARILANNNCPESGLPKN